MEGVGQDEQVLKDIFGLIAANEEAKLPERVNARKDAALKKANGEVPLYPVLTALENPSDAFTDEK